MMKQRGKTSWGGLDSVCNYVLYMYTFMYISPLSTHTYEHLV